MIVHTRALVLNRGEYGPFDDGRTVAYFDLVSESGGEPIRATLARGVEITEDELPRMFPADFDLDLGPRDKGGLTARVAAVRGVKS